MTPEERSLLESTHELALENNKLLQSIRRTHRFGVAIKIFYWVVIIALSVGAYYFVSPYVNMLTGLYSQGSGGAMNNIQETVGSLQELLR